MTTDVCLKDVEGLWRRRLLTAPGVDDSDTTVLWMQGDPWHVDMRVAPEFVQMGQPRSLAEFDGETLCRLTASEGFAGITDVTGGVATWDRHINYRGPVAAADIGALEWAGEELLETGVLADYAEYWCREGAAPVRSAAYRDGDGRMAVLVANDTHFALGRGDSRALSLADDLSVRVRKAVGSGDVTALNRLFDMEFSFGRREEQGGVITHSTDPSRPGTLAFEGRLEFNGTASLLTRSFDGREQASTWFAVWP